MPGAKKAEFLDTIKEIQLRVCNEFLRSCEALSSKFRDDAMRQMKIKFKELNEQQEAENASQWLSLTEVCGL